MLIEEAIMKTGRVLPFRFSVFSLEMGDVISSNTQSPYIFCWREYLMYCSFPDHFVSSSCFKICLIN